MPITRRRLVLRVIAWALVVIAVIGVFSPVNVVTHTSHIDLNSGRVRRQRRVFGVLVSSTVKDTAFSRLADELSLSRSPPVWQLEGARYYWLTPTTRDYGSGGYVISACRRLILEFELLEYREPLTSQETRPLKRQLVARFLQLMRERKLLQVFDESRALPETLDKMLRQAGIPKSGRQAKSARKGVPDREQRHDRPPDTKVRDED